MAQRVVGTSVTASQLKDLFRQIDDGSIDGEYMQGVLEHRWGAKVDYNPRLSLLATVDIPATDGSRTIAQASDVFPGLIDPDYKKWGLDVKSSPTIATPVQVFEPMVDGTFMDNFGSMSRTNDQCCHTQHQIIVFCQLHHEWLRTDGYGTFFMFKKDEKFFVADVNFDDHGRLDVYVHPLSYGRVWLAEYRGRFVFPQLAA